MAKVCLWVVATLAVASASGSGAGNCDAETAPILSAMRGVVDSTGWSVTATPNTFTLGSNVTFAINHATIPTFVGLNMYVEDAASDIKYGTFVAIPSEFKLNLNGNCQGASVLTHSVASFKQTSTRFKWTAPNAAPGSNTLTVRVLILWNPVVDQYADPNGRKWAVFSTTLTFTGSAGSKSPSRSPTTKSPTTKSPTAANPTPAPSTMAPTSRAPTTLAPTTLAPTPVPCQDGVKGPGETGIDCGGVCPTPCPEFMWDVGDWTPCSEQCGGGNQTRQVRCVSNGTTVLEANCSGLHEPETTQSCNPDPCANYTWDTGAFGECSSPCNTGTRTRVVRCLSSVGNTTVSDSLCGLGSKPLSDDLCNTDPCTGFHWSTQLWDGCTRTCDGGIQSRQVLCLDANELLAPSESLCTSVKPPTQQTCNPQTCTVYLWNPCPEFYPCTATCNGGDGMLGVRFKDVFCVDASTGLTVDNSLCPIATKPVTNFSVCNPQPCSGPNWMANANWGPCEQQTISGVVKFVRTRSFHCHNADGTTAPLSACQGVTQPLGSLDCVPNTCLKIPPELYLTSSAPSFSALPNIVFSATSFILLVILE